MYQFLHIESYSRTAPKSSKKGGNWSVSDIVKEANRDISAIPHVENPQVPTYLHGKPLEDLETACNDWAESMRDAKGRKMRKDALCLVAGVMSAPNDIEPGAWEAFKSDGVKWLQGKYGDRLQTVIEHTDESHPHLHFYVIPLPGERFETIHQGRAASAEAKASGELKGIQNQRYKAAMREYQDEFYNAVGIDHGFTRIGPGKRRLTREEWKLEQIQAEAAAAAIQKANDVKTTALGEAQDIKETARSEARKISQEALKKVDEIEQKAAEEGFKSGLDAVEKLPWWRKVGAVINRAVRERDELREEVKTIKAEKETWLEKAKGLIDKGARAAKRLREVEPELKAAKQELSVTRPRAKEADKLREKTEKLEDALSSERAKNQHLEATVEALNRHLEPENGPADNKARMLERGEEMSL